MGSGTAKRRQRGFAASAIQKSADVNEMAVRSEQLYANSLYDLGKPGTFPGSPGYEAYQAQLAGQGGGQLSG